jgi:hypothetical protein
VSVAEEDAIVDVGHVAPLEAALGQMIEDAAEQRLRIANAADVMDADVPLETGPAEHMGKAAGRIVALEYEDTLSAVPGKQCGGGETAYARANDDGVPVLVEFVLAIGDSNGLVAHGSS